VGIKIVDYRCDSCSEITTDAFEDDDICPICGEKMNRLYGFRKYQEYPAGYYENFDNKPLYINDREHFYKEAKKRGLDVYSSEYKRK
jgi:hypothetical protein